MITSKVRVAVFAGRRQINAWLPPQKVSSRYTWCPGKEMLFTVVGPILVCEAQMNSAKVASYLADGPQGSQFSSISKSRHLFCSCCVKTANQSFYPLPQGEGICVPHRTDGATVQEWGLGRHPQVVIGVLHGRYKNWTIPCVSNKLLSKIQFRSVQSLSPVWLCNPMNHSTPGLPVHHQLPEFTQTHVHWVGDAIQPSHPLSSPSPAPNPPQHQGLFEWVSSLHQEAKVLEFQPQHESFQWTPRTDVL